MMFNLNFRVYKNVIKSNVLRKRTNCWKHIKICRLTTQSIQEDIQDKPKHPNSPFSMFWTQMRPTLLEKHPGISLKEIICTSSKLWQQLDTETKSQFSKKYKEEYEVYKRNMDKYINSLSDDQKKDIARAEIKSAMSLEKRKLKKILKETGCPKRPPNPLILFLRTREGTFSMTKEHYEKLKLDWISLPESERIRYKIQYQELRDKYKKERTAWNNKMITEGRVELVKSRKTLKPSAEENLEFNISNNDKKALRPKAPLSPLLQFGTLHGKDKFRMTKEYFQKLKADWASLPESERDKYKVQYQENREQYKKDLTAWKNKMISEGPADLVLYSGKSAKSKTKKNIINFNDSEDIHDIKNNNSEISESLKTNDTKLEKNKALKNVNRISTVEFKNINNTPNNDPIKKELDDKPVNATKNESGKSGNIVRTLKNFFRF